MKEHPIIFSTEMIKAILEGKKTQTRRVIKIRNTVSSENRTHNHNDEIKQADNNNKDVWWTFLLGWEVGGIMETDYCNIKCPYGQVGDRLWVRESWSVSDGTIDQKYIYKADGLFHPDVVDASGHKSKGCWRSPIYMPRRASRITLEITDIRVERLQEIKTRDYLREGYPGLKKLGYGRPEWFKNLWNSLHKKQYRREDNPWVWVISFKRI